MTKEQKEILEKLKGVKINDRGELYQESGSENWYLIPAHWLNEADFLIEIKSFKMETKSDKYGLTLHKWGPVLATTDKAGKTTSYLNFENRKYAKYAPWPTEINDRLYQLTQEMWYNN